MFDIDWSNLEVYHYLAIGGGALIVLALLVALAVPKIKIAAGVLSTMAALALGVGLGVVGMTAFGYKTERPTENLGMAPPNMAPPGQPGAPGMMPGMMPGMGKGKGMNKGGPGGGPGGFKGKGPNPKTQLASLVVKMHQLSEAPLTLKLTEQQRQTVLEQLKGLEEPQELTEEDAESRLKGLLDVVRDQRPTLEAAGYRWPEGGPPALGQQAPNPFAMPENREHLTGLQAILGKKK